MLKNVLTIVVALAITAVIASTESLAAHFVARMPGIAGILVGLGVVGLVSIIAELTDRLIANR